MIGDIAISSQMFNRIRGEHITAKNIKADEHLVIAILPTMNSGEIRRNIKAAGDIECGLITQCVVCVNFLSTLA